MSWFVYLLDCADGSLYTGITRNPEERVAAHNRGVGAAYTRSRLPVSLAYLEPVGSKSQALRRELEIKRSPRRRKLALLASRSAAGRAAPLLTSPEFPAVHGFSTRAGGSSEGPYTSLNLGGNTADLPEAVASNRRSFAAWFGLDAASVSRLEQVHGERIVEAQAGEVQRADAQISDDPDLLLVISTADCLPILFHDTATGAVGAAHCGWRGTLAGLAATTAQSMAQRYGTRREDLQVAIGPGICAGCYQVGEDVAAPFRAAGFPAELLRPDDEQRWRLDLAGANRWLLEQYGLEPAAIHAPGWCTSCDGELFYSHRREAGVTGRHWAAVRATVPALTAEQETVVGDVTEGGR